MNKDKQAGFEAWLSTHCDYDDLNKSEIELANEAWQAALASTEVQALKKQRAELLSLVEEMVINDTYETEYDGRMYSICHGCSAQDDQDHNSSCVYVRARTALAAMEKQK